jgi:hypothetical protein
LQRQGFIVRKVVFPKADYKFDEISDIGKNTVGTIKLNEIAYTKLILSIDVKTSYGKIAFIIAKGYKIMDYPYGNSVTSWEKLKNKYESVSALSIIKLDKQFRRHRS